MLRAATMMDLPGILEIYNDAILNTTAVYEYKPFTMEVLEKWFAEKQEKQFPLIVMEEGGRLAGFASYGTFRVRPAYKYTVEHSVYVHPNFRGKGLGRKLLEAIIEEATQNGIHVMIGGIDASNTLSISLHGKLGFTSCGHIREAAYKFGKWLDLVFMQLILNGPAHPEES